MSSLVHHDPPIPAIDQSPRFASAKEINAQFCTEMEAAEHTQRALIIEIYRDGLRENLQETMVFAPKVWPVRMASVPPANILLEVALGAGSHYNMMQALPWQLLPYS